MTRPGLVAIILAGTALAYYVAVTLAQGDGGFGIAGDAHYVYLAARSLAFDGDLDLTNQYRGLGDRWGLGHYMATDGTRLPPREIGPSLLMVPGLWLHHALELDDSSAAAAATILAPLCIAAFFGLARKGLRQMGPSRGATLAAVFGALTFTLPFYAVGRTGYAHAPDAVVGAAIVASLIRAGPTWRVGVLVGVAVLFRLQNALWLLAMVPPTTAWRENWQRTARDFARATAPALLGLLPLIYLALAHPGAGFVRWDSSFFDHDDYFADLGRVVFGVHGLLTFTPAICFAVVGIVLACRSPSHGALARRLALVVLANVLLCAATRDPDAGDAFGARRLSGCCIVFTVGLSRLLATVSPRRGLAVAVTLGLVGLTAHNLARSHAAIVGQLSLASPRDP